MGANNYELKKRRIAVTLADSRARARNRFVARTNLHVVKLISISVGTCRMEQIWCNKQRLEVALYGSGISHLPHRKESCSKFLKGTFLSSVLKFSRTRMKLLLNLKLLRYAHSDNLKSFIVLIIHTGGWKAFVANRAYSFPREASRTVGRESEWTITLSSRCPP